MDKKVSVYMDPELHKRLKLRALDEDTTLQELLSTAAEKLLSSEPEPPLAPSLTKRQIKECVWRFETLLKIADPMTARMLVVNVEAWELLVASRAEKPQLPSPASD